MLILTYIIMALKEDILKSIYLYNIYKYIKTRQRKAAKRKNITINVVNQEI